MVERVKEKTVDYRPQNDRNQNHNQKNAPSSFDRLMQQARQSPNMTQYQQQATRNTTEQEKPRDEQTESKRNKPKQDRNANERNSEKNSLSSNKSEKSSESGKEHKVVEKIADQNGEGGKGKGDGQQQGSGHGGNSSGQSGKGYTGARSKGEVKSESYEKSKTSLNQEVSSKFQNEIQNKAAEQAREVNPKQLQQLVNLIVQGMRVGKNELGEEDLQVIFQAAIFKGLRLRLQNKDGKVLVKFSSSDVDVRKLFTKERHNISRRLAKQGIDVEAIEVGE